MTADIDHQHQFVILDHTQSPPLNLGTKISGCHLTFHHAAFASCP
jgi:hypothetical protein